jgi:hypothetical protein
MANRLRYETTGGHVSESATFAQLTEYLRLAEEACYTIGHLNKANDDAVRGEGFLRTGKMLAKVREQVTMLATSKGSLLS